METKPLPCPFCGQEPRAELNAYYVWRVWCGNAQCPVYVITEDYHHQGAVEAWNRRAALAPTGESPADDLRAENTRLRGLLADLAALVRGESPSLLNEDSGGDGRLSVEIDAALDALTQTDA